METEDWMVWLSTGQVSKQMFFPVLAQPRLVDCRISLDLLGT